MRSTGVKVNKTDSIREFHFEISTLQEKPFVGPNESVAKARGTGNFVNVLFPACL